VNGAGGDERVNPGPLGVLNGLPGSPNVVLVAAREAADYGNVTVVVHGVSDLTRDRLDGLEVVLGGGGEAGLDDVHAEFRELARHVELLLGRHGGSRGLLAVAERGVENADIRRVRNAVGDVRRTPPQRRLRSAARNGESRFELERRVSQRSLRETEGEQHAAAIAVRIVVVRGGGNEKRITNHGGHGETLTERDG